MQCKQYKPLNCGLHTSYQHTTAASVYSHDSNRWVEAHDAVGALGCNDQ